MTILNDLAAASRYAVGVSHSNLIFVSLFVPAAFFEGLGFRRREWKTLAKALQVLAMRTDVATSTESPHGWKYVIVGRIESPAGHAAVVQTIWIVDKGQDVARLVTAYPRKT